MTTPLLHRLILLLSLLFAAGAALATAQVPDIVLVDGKAESLFTNPLAPYLLKHPQALPQNTVTSTANWRGYVATWAIDDGLLVLRKIEQKFPKGDRKTVTRNVLRQVFPGRKPVVADWYSGTLVLPQGEMVEYVHMGYGSTFSDYRLFVVRNGRVLRDLKLDAAAFVDYRKARFEAFRKTPEFKQQLAEVLANDGYDEKMALEFLFKFYAEQYLSADDTAQ